MANYFVVMYVESSLVTTPQPKCLYVESKMKIDIDQYRIKPEAKLNLNVLSTNDTQSFNENDHKDEAKKYLAKLTEDSYDLQERLYAEGEQSLLVVFQAMDAGGKDSTTEKVFGKLNPQGVRVWSFKKPTEVELAHDFLWRVHRRAPGAGYIGVFNRSHYEDVLIVRVHKWVSEETIKERYEHIRNFESMLAHGGTKVVKIMLNISPEYQLARFRRRLEKPDKHWKFNPADLEERKLWSSYMEAFENAVSATSTEAAPWYVVPAEERWFRNVVVAKIVRNALRDLNPQYPPPDFDPSEYTSDSIS